MVDWLLKVRARLGYGGLRFSVATAAAGTANYWREGMQQSIYMKFSLDPLSTCWYTLVSPEITHQFSAAAVVLAVLPTEHTRCLQGCSESWPNVLVYMIYKTQLFVELAIPALEKSEGS